MPMPIIASVGALGVSASPLTLVAGAFQTDDILLAFYTTEWNETVTLTSANGFVETASSPQTAVIAGGIKLQCFWKRALSGSDAMPVTFDPTDHVAGFVVAVHGCRTTGNPWNISSGGNEAVADNSLSIPGATTTTADCLVVACVGDGVSGNGARWSAWANTDLASVTEIFDDGSNAVGGGAGLGAVTGQLATPGGYGSTTATFFTNSYKAYMTLALEGAAAPANAGNHIIQVRSGLRLS